MIKIPQKTKCRAWYNPLLVSRNAEEREENVVYQGLLLREIFYFLHASQRLPCNIDTQRLCIMWSRLLNVHMVLMLCKYMNGNVTFLLSIIKLSSELKKIFEKAHSKKILNTIMPRIYYNSNFDL